MRKLALSDDILLSVDKPARYIGGELNSRDKNLDDVDIRFVMCFPDVYEIGMSHIGMQIIYDMLNRREDTFCERLFSPWVDLDKILREKNIPLFSLESQENVKDADFLGITLQYEMCYTNILQVLELSHIPMYAKDRGDEYPIVIGGGPCAYNPEPLAPFFDIFYIGEGEVVYDKLLDLYKECKKNKLSKHEFLLKAAQMDGMYIPEFYDVTYKPDGTIDKFTPKYENVPSVVHRVVVQNMDTVSYLSKPVVPFIKVTQDRVVLEIMRGCIRGCRFCQAGNVYRPQREHSLDYLINYAKTMLDITGAEEISLSSLSSSDYSNLGKLLDFLLEYTKERGINISLPSLRIDAFSLDVMSKVQDVKKSSLTFAPEAGTQRLRDVINKGITEEELQKAVSKAFEMGWNSVKLYFMIGLPTERYEDLDGIKDLAYQVIDIYRDIHGGKIRGKFGVTISTSTFVPKPFTPFQWHRQDTGDEIRDKQKYLVAKLRNGNIRYNYHDSQTSLMEAVFARGDRRLGGVLLDAFKAGAKFDGWSEYFDLDRWLEAMDKNGLDPSFYAHRDRSYDEVFPWDHIDVGVTKEFLIRENELAKQDKVTEDCRHGCKGCGVNTNDIGRGLC